MSEESEYGLAISFPDQSPSYVHGYEMGLLAVKMRRGEDIEPEHPFHIENEECIRRHASYYGYEVDVFPCELDGHTYEGWIEVRFNRLIDGGRGPSLRLIEGGLSND